MSEFTKRRVTMQYTEVQYFEDGDLIATDWINDDHSYDSSPVEPMTADEIEDWT